MPDIIEIDCTANQEKRRPMTPAEQTARDAHQAQAAAAEAATQAAQQARVQDAAILRAKAQTDPAFAALTRLLADRLDLRG